MQFYAILSTFKNVTLNEGNRERTEVKLKDLGAPG